MALFMFGKLSRDWSQTSLILSLALSLIVEEELDSSLRNIVNLPCQAGFNNSLDGGDCLHGGFCFIILQDP